MRRAAAIAAVLVSSGATVASEVEFTDGMGREYRVEASVGASEGAVHVGSIDSVEVFRDGEWVEAFDYDESDIADAVINQTKDPWGIELECLQTEWDWAEEARGDAQREDGW